MRNKTREDYVAEFHKAFGHPIGVEATADSLALRFKLIHEEHNELRDEIAIAMVDVETLGAVSTKVKARLLKELADLQYVISGLAVELGLPLDIAFNRVHESNMTKLGEDGKPVYREDGKILKGPNYRPPDMESLFETVPGNEYY